MPIKSGQSTIVHVQFFRFINRHIRCRISVSALLCCVVFQALVFFLMSGGAYGIFLF